MVSVFFSSEPESGGGYYIKLGRLTAGEMDRPFQRRPRVSPALCRDHLVALPFFLVSNVKRIHEQ